MEKITNKSALQFVLDTYPEIPEDVRTKFEAMITAIEKKSSTDRKPTATQIENARLTEILWANIPAEGCTVTDVIKNIPEFEGLNTQKVTPMFKALEKAGRVRKESVKGRSFFYKVEG